MLHIAWVVLQLVRLFLVALACRGEELMAGGGQPSAQVSLFGGRLEELNPGISAEERSDEDRSAQDENLCASGEQLTKRQHEASGQTTSLYRSNNVCRMDVQTMEPAAGFNWQGKLRPHGPPVL